MTCTCRCLVTLLVLQLVAAPFGVNAQQHARVYRIGYIRTATEVEQKHLTSAFENALHEFDSAFAAMAQLRVDALVVLPDPVFFTARAQIVELATKHQLPAVYHAREVVEIGGLMSYGVSLSDQFRRAAAYVDKILKGARPGELAVEQATTFELVINLKTARAFGLGISPSLRMRADGLIE